jgi:hydroxymethylbilane synthase
MMPNWGRPSDIGSMGSYSNDRPRRIQLNPAQRPLIIASRASQLAKVQAHWVGSVLAARHPQLKVEYQWIESEGDKLIEAPLADLGGKGLFASAVEEALLTGKANLAVHSMKDLPADGGPNKLAIPAIPARADPRDCLISRHGHQSIKQLPEGAVVGTAGPRRAAQLLRLRPDLKIQLLRGNVQTRLRKILEGERSPDGLPYDATLMAVAGLQRSGLGQHAHHVVDPNDILPAAAQGALALQCRADDHLTIRRVLPLNDPVTSQAVHMERAVVAKLNGNCHSPIAVFAQLLDSDPEKEEFPKVSGAQSDPTWLVRARVLGLDGRTFIEVRRTAPEQKSGQLTKSLIRSLMLHGAQQVLAVNTNK